MRNSPSRKNGLPAIYLQSAVILLVAVAVVAVLLFSRPPADSSATLPSSPPPAGASSRLIFDLNGGSLSTISRFGFLDLQGITSTVSVPLPVGATYTFQQGHMLAFATSNRAATQFFTATYTVSTLGSADARQFSAIITGTNQIGDLYTFSPPLLAPDANSIAYILSHQQFVDNGLQVQLDWTLFRANLNTSARSTIGSGQLQATTIPAVFPYLWSSATNQIYLNVQTDSAPRPAFTATLYSLDTNSNGPVRQAITIPAPFVRSSPDGSKLAYLASSIATFAPQQAALGDEIIIEDLAGGNRQTITAAPGNTIGAAFTWSPDSHSLSYVEHLAPPTPLAGKQSAGDLFYHIRLKRYDLGGDQPLTLSEYRANSALSEAATNSQLFWCGSHIYLAVTSFIGGGKSQGSLYSIAADGSGGLRPTYPGDWHYPILDCAP